MIKLFIFESHHLIHLGLINLFAQQNEFKLLEITHDSDDLGNRILRNNPDVLLCDIDTQELNIIELMDTLQKNQSKTKIVLFSCQKNSRAIYQMIELNPNGIIHKSEKEEDILEGLQKIAQNQQYFSPFILEKSQTFWGNESDFSNKNNPLSTREIEVLKLLAEGFKNSEIADRLFISPKTVDNHRANILKKLKLRNNAELTRYALRQHLIQ